MKLQEADSTPPKTSLTKLSPPSQELLPKTAENTHHGGGCSSWLPKAPSLHEADQAAQRGRRESEAMCTLAQTHPTYALPKAAYRNMVFSLPLPHLIFPTTL